MSERGLIVATAGAAFAFIVVVLIGGYFGSQDHDTSSRLREACTREFPGREHDCMLRAMDSMVRDLDREKLDRVRQSVR